MSRYWAYGLTVASEFPFPELYPLPDEGPIDVELDWLEQHNNLPEPLTKDTALVEASLNFHVPGIADYTARQGRSIAIRPFQGADQADVRFYCLSNAFAAILHQRNILPMHCGAFEHKGELVLIAGDSGAGKSTLLMELDKLGFPTFSDDVCVPHCDENNRVVFYSSYPVRKLWQTELEHVEQEALLIRTLPEGTKKYAVSISSEFSIQAMKPKAVFFIMKSDVLCVAFHELAGIEKFSRWESNAYRGEFYRAQDLRSQHFRLITQLAEQVKAFSIERPVDGNTINDITNRILHTLEEMIVS